MKANAEAVGITLEEAPIASTGTLGVVERYHAPLRSVYSKLRLSLSKGGVSDHGCLHMAVYVNNATMGPKELCSMLFVFGSLPRTPERSHPPLSLSENTPPRKRKRRLNKNKQRDAFLLLSVIPEVRGRWKYRKSYVLSPGSPVLVYITVPKIWEGPFKFISMEGETFTIQLSRGRKIFRSYQNLAEIIIRGEEVMLQNNVL